MLFTFGKLVAWAKPEMERNHSTSNSKSYLVNQKFTEVPGRISIAKKIPRMFLNPTASLYAQFPLAQEVKEISS